MSAATGNLQWRRRRSAISVRSTTTTAPGIGITSGVTACQQPFSPQKLASSSTGTTAKTRSTSVHMAAPHRLIRPTESPPRHFSQLHSSRQPTLSKTG
jgi:hypothetical protein